MRSPRRRAACSARRRKKRKADSLSLIKIKGCLKMRQPFLLCGAMLVEGKLHVYVHVERPTCTYTCNHLPVRGAPGACKGVPGGMFGIG